MTSPSTPESRGSFFGKKLTLRQKLTRRLLPALFLIATIGAGAAWNQFAGSPADAAESSSGNKPLEVQTLAVKQSESYSRHRTFTGLLRESRRSQISFQRPGEVTEILVDEGQRVSVGQKLAHLDDRHIRARQSQVQAQLIEAEAVLAELLEGPRKETIAAKRAELAALEAQAKVLAGQVSRREQLVKNASVSREEYETFLYDYQAANARADVARRQLDELLAGTRKEQIAAQRARVSQLQAQLADVAHDLEDTVLLAPFAGRVSQRLIDEGTVIAAGTPVAELLDDEHLEAWIGLSTDASSTLQVGQRRILSVDGKEIESQVYAMAPDVDRATRTQNVIFRLDLEAQGVLPGQVVRVAVTESVQQPGFWVPTTSLTRGTRGLWSVYVVEQVEQEEVVARRDVELLDTLGQLSYVRGTLQTGDQIVASGTHRVVVGQKVSTSAEKIAAQFNSSAPTN